jgi:sugar phosphate isomerase/epimerase
MSFLGCVRVVVQFAVQSIVWGKEVENLEQMLDEIHKAGYHGVELFQDIAEKAYGGPAGVGKAFRDCGLTLVGVSSASLTERIDFVSEYCGLLGVSTTDSSAPYVYADEWNEHCVAALRKGLRIGLHPHMFRPVQTMQEAAAIMHEFAIEDYPHLQLLPDTAHLTIAGDDPIETVRKFFPRMAAVHVTDWIPNVGRSYQFYASGFCALGTGDVKLGPVLDFLWKRQFNGWIVVEHDYSIAPRKRITSSMDWLRTVLPPTIFQ